MSCEVTWRRLRWNRIMYETFLREAKLSNNEKTVLDCIIEEQSRVQIALSLHVSLSTLDRRIKRIKQKYMDVQPRNADVLPPIIILEYNGMI